MPPAGAAVSDWDDQSGFASGTQSARARAREDVAACALTRSRRIGLRHLDQPYRAGADLPASAIRTDVARLLGPTGILWIPASIGDHADHVAATVALLPLARELAAARVRVYADLPYAGWSSYDLPTRIAEALPGLQAKDVHLRGAAFRRKIAAVRCHASQLVPLGVGAPDMLRAEGVLARERVWAA